MPIRARLEICCAQTTHVHKQIHLSCEHTERQRQRQTSKVPLEAWGMGLGPIPKQQPKRQIEVNGDLAADTDARCVHTFTNNSRANPQSDLPHLDMFIPTFFLSCIDWK